MDFILVVTFSACIGIATSSICAGIASFLITLYSVKFVIQPSVQALINSQRR